MDMLSGIIGLFGTIFGSSANILQKGVDVLKIMSEGVSYYTAIKEGVIPQKGKEADKKISETNDRIVQIFVNGSNRDLSYVLSRQFLEQSPFIQHIVNADPVNTRDFLTSPENSGFTNVQHLRDVQSLQYYRPNSLYRPIIFPNLSGENMIGFVPLPVLRYHITNKWEFPTDLGRLKLLGIDAEDIIPEIANWFKILSAEDQAYFSRLYKEYYQVAEFSQIKPILDPTKFTQELFQRRNEIQRSTGARTVLFRIKTRSVNGVIREVYIEPQIIP